MVIGKTSYNVDAVKRMTVKEFVKSHKHLREVEAESAYYLLTGFERPKPQRKKEKEKEVEDVSASEE